MLPRNDARLLSLLTDPETASLSNREIGRRTGFNHHYVGGYRTAIEATKWDPPDHDGRQGRDLGPSPSALPPVLVGPPSGTLSIPGHTVAFEPRALNSYDCWAMATARERTKFVDAVGLRHLFRAAPIDHREAFLRQISEAA